MKAARRLAANVSALLAARRDTQHDLAQWCRKSDPWVSQFLRGERNWMLEDLDRVADFFGIATYQLFQPGISALTERRVGADRRSQRERRIGHSQRVMLDVAAEVDAHRPRRKGAHVAVVAASPQMAALAKLTEDYERRVSALLTQAESRGQAPAARPPIAETRARRRAARGPDAEGA
jgi:hypothetical protein